MIKLKFEVCALGGVGTVISRDFVHYFQNLSYGGCDHIWKWKPFQIKTKLIKVLSSKNHLVLIEGI